jgi:3-methyladenine DNA glycosylase AlkD
MEALISKSFIPGIRHQLLQKVELKYREGITHFFRGDPVKFHGVRTPHVRAVSAEAFKAIKEADKGEVWALCDRLLESGYGEERTIAFDWAWRLRRSLEPSDFKYFERWLTKYCRDWAGVDDLSCHPLGYLLYKFPELLPRLAPWRRSPKWHLRRASAVALIYLMRREKQLDLVLKTSDALLMDEHDLVQKGYGWLLKEATKHYPKIVFDYVLKHKGKMPRTALRYAIEKLPAGWKRQAMAR